MAALLGTLRNAIIAGLALALLVFVIAWETGALTGATFWPFLLRWLHTGAGIIWIGLLWYSESAAMGDGPPANWKAARSGAFTRAAFDWLRWSAMATFLLGIALAAIYGYLFQAYTLDASEGFSNPKIIVIGIGMWLATAMCFNVWFVIWPNLRKALNTENRYPNLTQAQRGAAFNTAASFRRVNAMLSIPMLFCMVGATHMIIG